MRVFLDVIYAGEIFAAGGQLVYFNHGGYYLYWQSGRQRWAVSGGWTQVLQVFGLQGFI